MKRILLVVCVLLIASLAFAQENSKATVFGGYSFLSVDTNGGDRENFNGWNGAVTGNFTKHIGITADISGHYKDISGAKINSYSFLFGPQVGGYYGKAHPFVHALFGANRVGADVPAFLSTSGSSVSSDTSYAIAFGGGLDVNLNKTVGIRIGQFDYLRTHHFDLGQNNVRFSAGIVLNLGGK